MPTFEEIANTIRQPTAVVAIILVFSWISQALFKRSVRRLRESSFLAAPTAQRLITTSRVMLTVLATLAALQATGIFAEAWAIVSAAIAALAVAFVATWSLLSNVTAALLLLVFRPFRVGDRIEVVEGDKVLVAGIVLDLNLTFTTVHDDADFASRIPNNLLLQRVIRVSRAGKAPDPHDDTSAPFF